MYFPATHTRRHELASVLDLEQYHLSGSGQFLQAGTAHPQALPYSGDQTILMLISINDVNFVKPEGQTHPLQDDQTHRVCLMIMQGIIPIQVTHALCTQSAFAHRLFASKKSWWVEEDLNLRPHAYQACALTT